MGIQESIHFPFLQKRVPVLPLIQRRTIWVTDQRAEETYGLLLYREKTYS
jgi:hypothetical protein